MESTEEDLIRYYHSLLAKSLTLLTQEKRTKIFTMDSNTKTLDTIDSHVHTKTQVTYL